MEGTAPNRVFTVQWKHYKRYGTTYVGDDFNFQIKLYETSNLVEVVYGPFTVLYVATPPYGPQVGLRGNSNADFNNRTMDASQSWATSVAGTTNADSMTLTDLIYPANGLTYDWSLATGLFLDPASQSGSVCPGSDVVYDFDVVNQTGVAQALQPGLHQRLAGQRPGRHRRHPQQRLGDHRRHRARPLGGCHRG